MTSGLRSIGQAGFGLATPDAAIGPAGRFRRALLVPGLLAGALGCLASAAAPAPAAWHAAATTSVETREVSFRNGDAILSGTLHAPRGAGKFPAIVVTHGASSATRDLPLYRHLTEMLPPLGVAVFVYDRRGSGKSGGDLKTSDYNLLADDAIAAKRAIAADLRIDAGRIGFWGLSQGGWLALLAASRDPSAAFAIRSRRR